MTQTFDVGHLGAHFGSFAFFFHLFGGEINREGHEGHENFAWFFRSAGLAIGERGLLARSARQLAEHKFPPASCRRLQAGSLRSPETEANGA